MRWFGKKKVNPTDPEVAKALDSLAEKGLAKKHIIDGKTEYSMTVEGLQVLKEMQKPKLVKKGRILKEEEK
jgi:predicted transcriptional regulator